MKWRALIFVSLALGAFALWALAGAMPALAEEGNVIESAAEIVDTCSGCHDLDSPGYAQNPHRILDRDANLAAHLGVESSCTSCHGDVSTHIEEGGGEGNIFAFHGQPPTAQSDRCLTCHSDAHPRFFATNHAAAGMSCVSCHDIHGDDVDKNLLASNGEDFGEDLQEDLGPVSASCANCHGDILSYFKFNEHHRLTEGILDCTSCHNPHEPATRTMLGGFKQDQCVTCHQDKGGPFVFEHASQRVEGCVACHDPHGGPNRHMLKFQSVADLCYSCHIVVPSFHSRFTNETNCTNCHSSIHGSNFHPAFLK